MTCVVGSQQTTARRECLQEEGEFAAAGRTHEKRTCHGPSTGCITGGRWLLTDMGRACL